MSDFKMALSLREAAQALGCSYGTILKAVNDGRLPARRLGDRWLVGKSQLEGWLDEKGKAVNS